MGKGYFVFRYFIIVAVFLLISPTTGWTQAEDTQEDRLEDRLEEEKGEIVTSAQELIEMLKNRALRSVESERKKQLRATKGTIGLHLGHDNNVNTDSERRGDTYFEQYFSFDWVPTLSNYFSGEVGTWYYSDCYFDNKDTTILDNAFKASLKYYPRGEPSFELQPGVERAYAHYPYATDSTYVEDKAFLKFKHRFWKKWSQDGKYEYSFKEYDTKKPRTGASSTSYILSQVLEKTKQTVEYNLGFPWGQNNMKLKQKLYKETSNDAYNDYYDLHAYKVTGELGRSLTKKLYSKLSFAYEKKNYLHRTVTEYQVAREDSVYTQKLYFYYTLKKGWTLSYTFTHKSSECNYNLYDYNSVSHLAGIYISF